ncbi:MAG: hypothetical protein ABW110_04585 [Steroidobacteraceae bacterium]
MKWLQAALAFSLLMLVLATIVTIILETAYRALLTREKGFRIMMGRLFDEVLKPRVIHLLRGVTIAEAREHFLDTVTRNQAYDEEFNRVRGFVQPDQLASMTMMEFADRLADTAVGRAIARGGSEYVDNAINDLAQKFDRFGAASSKRYQDHARFWCVLASIILALMVNVDAVRVFQELLHDDQLTSSVIARYGAAVEEGAQRPQDLKESLALMSQLRDEHIIEESELEAFKDNIATAQLKVAELRDTGLPITIEAWPFCTGVLGNTGRSAQSESNTGTPAANAALAPRDAQPKPADRKCTAVTELPSWQGFREVARRLSSSAGAVWLLSVLLAGVLVGLGAPFWFDLARGLTRSAQILRAAGVGSKDEKKPAPAVIVTQAGASSPPQTPVEAFKVAIAAAQPPRARILLSPTGRPVRRV